MKALIESECVDEDMQKNMLIDNEAFDIIEPKVDGKIRNVCHSKRFDRNFFFSYFSFYFSVIQIYSIDY